MSVTAPIDSLPEPYITRLPDGWVPKARRGRPPLTETERRARDERKAREKDPARLLMERSVRDERKTLEKDPARLLRDPDPRFDLAQLVEQLERNFYAFYFNNEATCPGLRGARHTPAFLRSAEALRRRYALDQIGAVFLVVYRRHSDANFFYHHACVTFIGEMDLPLFWGTWAKAILTHALLDSHDPLLELMAAEAMARYLKQYPQGNKDASELLLLLASFVSGVSGCEEDRPAVRFLKERFRKLNF